MKGKPIEPGTSPIVELSEVKLVDLTQSTTERESNVPAVAVTALLAHGDPAHRRKTTIGLAAEEAYANRLSASIVKRIIGYEPRHDTEDIEHATLGTVQIDVAMVPLVQAVWDAGVDTDSCCQGEWYIENIDFGATLDSNASIGIAVGWHVPDCRLPEWLTIMLYIKDCQNTTAWEFPKSAIPDLADLVDRHGLRQLDS